MVNLAEIEAQAMMLPDSDRAALAEHLLGSLPGILHEDDLGLAEAMRRDAELDENPSIGMTIDELRKSLGR